MPDNVQQLRQRQAVGDEPSLAELVVQISVLLFAACAAALIGRQGVTRAIPPVPVEAVASLKQDVHTFRSGDHS